MCFPIIVRPYLRIFLEPYEKWTSFFQKRQKHYCVCVCPMIYFPRFRHLAGRSSNPHDGEFLGRRWCSLSTHAPFSWVTVCTGGAGVQRFSRLAWEYLLLVMLWGQSSPPQSSFLYIYIFHGTCTMVHVLSMATVLNVGTPQVAILVHHFIFFFCTFLRTVKHFISKCQWYHLENKVSLIMRLPDVGSSESCFDWLYKNLKIIHITHFTHVHFFISKTTSFFYSVYNKRSYDDQESFILTKNVHMLIWLCISG